MEKPLPPSEIIDSFLMNTHIKYNQEGKTFTKIRGLKALREQFGLGLSEAKTLIENSSHPFESDYQDKVLIEKIRSSLKMRPISQEDLDTLNEWLRIQQES